MIEIAGLEKTFFTHKGELLCAVGGLSLSVARGEVYGLLGPNGAGKTTTLRMLAGLMTPTAGRIRVDGVAAIDAERGIWEPMALKERIGFLTANTGLYGRLSPREVLDYFGELRGLSGATLRQQTERWIALLEIGEFAERRCEGLSTGQKQRVQIARTLVGDPPVLVLDEPTHGLDVLSNQLILNFIAEAGRQGRTIVLSTHHLDEVEEVCQRFGLMYKGKMIAEGTLPELRAASGKERLSAIFRELVARVDMATRGSSVTLAAVEAPSAPPPEPGGTA
ncbi:MAG: ABC transporter ATP-binding protein [Planctomycetota bacterium]|nr:ABC transporter ATP-binding protein [Planctomycetota bacterium]